jgi:hypothetical protein
MTHFHVCSEKARRRTRAVAAIVVALLLPSPAARAQADDARVETPVADIKFSSGNPFHAIRLREIVVVLQKKQNIASITALGRDRDVVSGWQPAPAFQASSGGRQRSTKRKVIGGIIGAVGGFFGGAFLGAAIEGDRCECDDPGFVGFWIGAPVGSVVGGIVGAKWL